MVTDEMLKKLKDNAWKIINEDERRGATVTLAMDPVTVYLIARELMVRREKEPWELIAKGLPDDDQR
jgi:hypothetical protein